MHITLNGALKHVPEGISLQDLIAEYKLSADTIIVELNLIIIERKTYADVTLKEGDRLELVRLVGGG